MSTLTRANVVGVVAGVVRWLGLAFALVLAVHVILTMGNANPANGITEFFSTTADWFVLAFRNLFTPDDQKLRVLVNYGLAAVFWMIVSAVLSRLVRRLA
jgi:Na+/alanine symporter